MTMVLEREHTVLPPEQPLGELYDLLTAAGSEPITLMSPDGKRILLPHEIFDALSNVVKAMVEGQAVLIAPVHQRLTTQEAADLLGISRPTFVKLLETDEIPYERPGRHRRVLLVDVLDYRNRRSTQRRAALDRMVEIAEESGMYERARKPRKTR